MNRLADIRHFALDLDGTLYLGGRVFPFTRAFLDRLASLGIGRTFFTNNSSKSTSQYVEHLRKMGVVTAWAQGFLSIGGRRLAPDRWREQLSLWAPEEQVGVGRQTFEFSPGTFR